MDCIFLMSCKCVVSQVYRSLHENLKMTLTVEFRIYVFEKVARRIHALKQTDLIIIKTVKFEVGSY